MHCLWLGCQREEIFETDSIFKESMRFSSILALREPPGTWCDFVHIRKWYAAQFNQQQQICHTQLRRRKGRKGGLGWPNSHGIRSPVRQLLVHGFCHFLSTICGIATTASVPYVPSACTWFLWIFFVNRMCNSNYLKYCSEMKKRTITVIYHGGLWTESRLCWRSSLFCNYIQGGRANHML